MPPVRQERPQPLVMVVDDILANRRLMQAKLEAKGYRTLLVEGGPDSLELLRTAKPDAILLDVMMPGMDGYEACRRLKDIDPHIPIIFLTALNEDEDEKRGMEAGADAWFTKPVHDFELDSALDSLISQFRARRTLPNPKEGLQVEVSKAGLLDLANSGPVNADDRLEIEAVREVLIDAARELQEACAASNSYNFLDPLAQKYRRELEVLPERISIDKLYAYGIRLENAAFRIRKDEERDFLPAAVPRLGEALDTVLALHGTVILGTSRGRSLLHRASEYNSRNFEIAEYKQNSTGLFRAASTEPAMLTPDASEMLLALNDLIGEGDYPERSTHAAKSANFNFFNTVGKLALFGAGNLAAAGLAQSQAGSAASSQIANLVDVCTVFLAEHEPRIRALAAASSVELNWVNALLDWIILKRPPPNTISHDSQDRV